MAQRIERIQDTIHGLMEFQGMETSVVNVLRAQELQRLRRVRQLGLTHFVFPGAEHSRLVHAIGTSYLAVRFARHLRETTREVLVPFLRPTESATRDLALAGLCHDLGHGPLSHVWEREVIGENFERARWTQALGLEAEPGFDSLRWHELVSQAFLAWPEGELHRLLEQQEDGSSKRIRRLLAGDFYIPYFPRLLSSDVDIDRCDFILRDAHQTGVAYGRYDLNWLVSTVTVGKAPDNRLVVGFDKRKAPRVVEQLLIARRALYDTVYFHKTVRSAEGMIGLALRRLKEVARESGWPITDTKLFDSFRKVIEGTPVGPHEILDLDDYSLWVLVEQLAASSRQDPTLQDLARRIVARDLFKMVPFPEEPLREFLLREEAHSRLHDAVAPYSPGKKEYYIYIDRAGFEMFCTAPKLSAYFVDIERKDRAASPIREHHHLRPLWGEPQMTVRLYVPREAVTAVLKVLTND